MKVERDKEGTLLGHDTGWINYHLLCHMCYKQWVLTLGMHIAPYSRLSVLLMTALTQSKCEILEYKND